MYERASKRKNDRPLLKGMNIKQFEDLYFQRKKLYLECAATTINVDKKSIEDITTEIINNEKNSI